MSTRKKMSVSAPSTIHGERIWRRVGERDHVTRDGRAIALAVWETPCVICGEPFQITIPMKCTTSEQSKSFEKTTCPEHLMTPYESGRLGAAKADKRRALFEVIKRDKLIASAGQLP